MSPAQWAGGARATIEFYNSLSVKKSGKARKQTGKKEGGLGEGIFARLLCPAKRGWGWESVSAIPTLAGRQNRKIFVSLIEKNFGGARIKKCKENFSVLSAVRRAETLGGNQSAKSSGFCSKWVRISSNKHHQIELAASRGTALMGDELFISLIPEKFSC